MISAFTIFLHTSSKLDIVFFIYLGFSKISDSIKASKYELYANNKLFGAVVDIPREKLTPYIVKWSPLSRSFLRYSMSFATCFCNSSISFIFLMFRCYYKFVHRQQL